MSKTTAKALPRHPCILATFHQVSSHKSAASPDEVIEWEVESYRFRLAKSLDAIAEEWSAWDSPEADIWQSSAYLRTLSKASPVRLSPRYLLIHHRDGRLLARVPLQVLAFNLGASLRGGIPTWKRWLANLVGSKLLVCGNALLTGNHLWESTEEARFALATLISEVLPQIARMEGANALLVKDFFARQAQWEDAQYHPFAFQPCMRLAIQPEWNTFEDYLNAMSSKYRVRTRRAFKKAESLTWKVLSLEDLLRLQPEMHELYMQVADGAGFSLVDLPPTYFFHLQNELGDKCRITGCFSPSGELLGFYSAVLNVDKLEAHFLGFNQEANRENQLYLNMLYRLVDEGIARKAREINFSRTALEIKSSVGAEPHDTWLYLRCNIAWINRLFPIGVPWFSPAPEEWIPRRPFKE